MSLFTVEPNFSGLDMDETDELVNEILPDFVDSTRDFALAIASQQVMSMEVFDFIQQGLDVRQEGSRIIVETFEKAEFFEKGWAPFDLGQAILDNSNNVKTSEDGNRYAHVPIYQGGMTRVNPLTEKGYRSRALTQGARSSQENPYGIKKKSRNLIPDARRYARSAGNLKYKTQRPPKYNTQGGEFKTVSDKSLNWQHPGIEGLHYAEMAAEYMESMLQDFLENYFEEEQ